jgi:hypothetical protein
MAGAASPLFRVLAMGERPVRVRDREAREDSSVARGSTRE